MFLINVIVKFYCALIILNRLIEDLQKSHNDDFENRCEGKSKWPANQIFNISKQAQNVVGKSKCCIFHFLKILCFCGLELHMMIKMCYFSGCCIILKFILNLNRKVVCYLCPIRIAIRIIFVFLLLQ